MQTKEVTVQSADIARIFGSDVGVPSAGKGSVLTSMLILLKTAPYSSQYSLHVFGELFSDESSTFYRPTTFL